MLCPLFTLCSTFGPPPRGFIPHSTTLHTVHHRELLLLSSKPLDSPAMTITTELTKLLGIKVSIVVNNNKLWA